MPKTGLLAAVLAMAAVPAAAMTLTSPDVGDGARVPGAQVYGDCNGGNVSPQLAWSGTPDGTKSFAVTLFDPDAPGGGFWHWIAFAIPANRRELPRGAGNSDSVPAVMQGTNDFGRIGYGGPCPPPGDGPHRYQFTLWALDSAKPPFGHEASGAALLPWLQKHTLGKATLTATYGR